jgi:hypothetical protein
MKEGAVTFALMNVRELMLSRGSILLFQNSEVWAVVHLRGRRQIAIPVNMNSL